jgi:uncharacterized protein (TIGR00369 family)
MGSAIPRQRSFDSCFACGPENLRGLRLRFEREDDRVTATFTPPPELGGYGALLHGGITSTLLDEALVWAVYGLLGELSLTTELRVRFLRPIRCGEALALTGVLGDGLAQGVMARAELRDTGGRLCADAEGSMRFMSARAAERLGRRAPAPTADV